MTTAAYKLVTLRSPGWNAYKGATLLISIGQPYHEGEKFAVAAAWAARHFERLHLLVADTLQRHNAPGDWRGEGRAWVARNWEAWASYKREVTLSHWDDWRSRPEFATVLQQFRSAADGLLGQAIDRDAARFVERQTAKGQAANIDQCRAYLLEELAAITLQAREYPGVRVYPGPALECFRVVAAGLVADAPCGLERQYHTAIDFKRRRPAPSPERALA